jgi:hypothetical protein
VIYHCKVGIMLCILDTLASSIHFSGAMKLTFFKASLLRKLRAVDKSKSKYEWSEWSKRTYTYYIVSYHCYGHNNLRVLTYAFFGKPIVYNEFIVISLYDSYISFFCILLREYMKVIAIFNLLHNKHERSCCFK